MNMNDPMTAPGTADSGHNEVNRGHSKCRTQPHRTEKGSLVFRAALCQRAMGPFERQAPVGRGEPLRFEEGGIMLHRGRIRSLVCVLILLLKQIRNFES